MNQLHRAGKCKIPTIISSSKHIGWCDVGTDNSVSIFPFQYCMLGAVMNNILSNGNYKNVNNTTAPWVWHVYTVRSP